MTNWSGQFDVLREKLTAGEFSEAASKFGEAASQSIAGGFELLQEGDSYGGAAKLLEGLGALAKLGGLLGPGGAAAGGVFSVITGIIAAIVEALNPEKESLEDRLKDALREVTLENKEIDLRTSENTWLHTFESHVTWMANARKALSESAQAGKEFQFDDSRMYMLGRVDNPADRERLLKGYTLDELKADVEYMKPVEAINTALSYLRDYPKKADPYTETWYALMDQTLGYMFRTWVGLHGVMALAEKTSYGKLRDDIRDWGDQWKDALRELEFSAQNVCPIYSRWHFGRAEDFDYTLEPVSRRIGVCRPEWAAYHKLGSAAVVNFAVSSRGTVFSVATFRRGLDYHALPTAGRPGKEWEPAPGDFEVDQIFIGELPDKPGLVVVACTGDNRRSLSLGSYDEGEGRWGDWKHLTFSSCQIASVAFEPKGHETYAIYALTLRDDMAASLVTVDWNGDQKFVEGFWWNKEEVKNAGGMNILREGGWSDLSPLSCAISFNPLAVQLGNTVKFREGSGSTPWNLQGPNFFYDDSLKTHQGRFYSDGTFVMCSNRGVDMRYWKSDPKHPDGGSFQWKNDPTNQGEVVQKIPLQNAHLFWAMQRRLSLPES